MKYTISGLTYFALGYAVFFILTPLWRRNLLPEWTRVPRGIVAWLMMGSLLGPAWGFGELLVELFTLPNMGTAMMLGSYAFMATGIAWLYSNHEAINYDQVRPLIVYSLFFQKPVNFDKDVFAVSEQATIHQIYKEQTGKDLSFKPLKKKHEPITRDQAAAELDAIRRQRQTDAGKEDLDRLQAGEGADITDVLRLFTMHRPPHHYIEKTFRVFVDPTKRECAMDTVFPGFRKAQMAKPDSMFRFKQDIIDLLQVFSGQDWLDRFRPYFDAIVLLCYQEVRDSFDLPQRQAFMRLTISLEHLDAHKGKVFIATELDTLGTVEWLKDSEA